MSLLPACEGFFFGGTSYDEVYFEHLEYTVKLIDEFEVEEKKNEEGYFRYSYYAWW